MTTTTVWLMVIVATHGSIAAQSKIWSTGPEFTTREKCEVAAQTVAKSVDVKTLICVKIEK